MKLASMIDFVLHCTKSVDEMDNSDLLNQYAYKLDKIEDYATFLNQPLNIGMFVPAIEVGGEWEVLEMPDGWGNVNVDREMTEHDYKYKTAKDRVLFEGFKVETIRERCGNVFYLVKDIGGGNIYVSWNNSKTINDLIKYAPTLTAKGQQLSGLNE